MTIDRLKLLIHESTGQSYENLFVKIMSYADADFKAVKAHGNLGDRGNDGWNPKKGIYYQVYAPEELFVNKSKIEKKINEDFDKLYNYWNKIEAVNEFIFVVNDRYKGVPPMASKNLKEIKDKYHLDSATIMTSQDLENVFIDLDEKLQKQIVSKGTEPLDLNCVFDSFYDISCAKYYFNEFRTNTYVYQVYNNSVFNKVDNMISSSFDKLKMSGLEIVKFEPYYLFFEKNKGTLPWDEKEKICDAWIAEMRKYNDLKRVISLAHVYTKIQYLHAQGLSYEIELINFTDAIRAIDVKGDKLCTDIIDCMSKNSNEVKGKITKVSELTKRVNDQHLLNIYKRISHLLAIIEN